MKEKLTEENLGLYMIRLWSVKCLMELRGKNTACIDLKIKNAEYQLKSMEGII